MLLDHYGLLEKLLTTKVELQFEHDHYYFADADNSAQATMIRELRDIEHTLLSNYRIAADTALGKHFEDGRFYCLPMSGEDKNFFVSQEVSGLESDNLSDIRIIRSVDNIEDLLNSYKVAVSQCYQLHLRPCLTERGSFYLYDKSYLPLVQRHSVCPDRAALQMHAQQAVNRNLRDSGQSGSIDIFPTAEGDCYVLSVFDHAVADQQSINIMHRNAASSPPIEEQHIHEIQKVQLKRVMDKVATKHSGFWDHLEEKITERMDTTVQSPRIHTQKDAELSSILSIDMISSASRKARTTNSCILLAAFVYSLSRHKLLESRVCNVVIDSRSASEKDLFGRYSRIAPLFPEIHWGDDVLGYIKSITGLFFDACDFIAEDPLKQIKNKARFIADTPVFVFNADGHAEQIHEKLNLPLRTSATLGTIVCTVQHHADNELSLVLRSSKEVVGERLLQSVRDYLIEFIRVVAHLNTTIGFSDLQFVPASHRAIIETNNRIHEQYPYEPVAIQILRKLKTTPSECLHFQNRTYDNIALRQKIIHYIVLFRRERIAYQSILAVNEPNVFHRIALFIACLRMGIIYLPFDESLKVSERQHIIFDSGAHYVWEDGVISTANPERDDGCGHAHELQHRPSHSQFSLSLAYVIYTSGSTGKPKGVAVSQIALSNLVQGEQQRFCVDSTARVLFIAPCFVDPWICHVCSCLYNSATLVHCVADGTDSLETVITGNQVTHVFAPSALLPTINFSDCRSLRMVASAGDHIDPTVVSTLKKQKIDFYNIYGPTEATVNATVNSSASTAQPHSIGRAIAGYAVYIVLAENVLAPPEVLGEIQIRGVGIANGYIRDQTLLFEKPFIHVDDVKGFNTGDLGYLGSCGNLYIQGRMDRQIKVLGFRVGLDNLEQEIKAQLGRDDIAIIGKKNAASAAHSQTELSLFYTDIESKAIDSSMLKSFLKPASVPARYILLDKLPMLKSNKVDYEALSRYVDNTTISLSKAKVLDGGLQDKILWAMQQVLHVKMAPNDNFFSYGGDSLKLLFLVRQLSDQGTTVRPSDIYSFPTAAALAVHCGQQPRPEREWSFPSTFVTKKTPTHRWFDTLAFDDPNRWNLTTVLDFATLPTKYELRLAFKRLLISTPILSSKLGATPDSLQVEQVNDIQPLLDRFLFCEYSESAVKDSLETVHGSFNPSEAASIAGLAIQTYGSAGLVVLVAHHLVADHWSMRLLAERFKLALANNQTQLKTDYGFFAYSELLRERIGRLREEVNIPFLSTHRANVDDAPRTNIRNTKICQQRFATKDTSIPVTVFSLLAGVQDSLFRTKGNGITVVDLERNGRTVFPDQDYSDAVGWFGLHHPMMLEHGEISDDAIQQLERMFESVSYQGLGYMVIAFGEEADNSKRSKARMSINIVEAENHRFNDEFKAWIDDVSATASGNILPYEQELTLRFSDSGVTILARYNELTSTNEDVERLVNGIGYALRLSRIADHSHDREIDTLPVQQKPASSMQQLMLRASLNYNNTCYQVGQLLLLQSMSLSNNDIVDRIVDCFRHHSVFYTRFSINQYGSVQRYQVDAEPDIYRMSGDIESAMTWLHNTEVDVQFLDEYSPCRLALWEDCNDGVLLGMRLHHALMDGFSNQLLQRSLVAGVRRNIRSANTYYTEHFNLEGESRNQQKTDFAVDGLDLQTGFDEHRFSLNESIVSQLVDIANRYKVNLRALLIGILLSDETFRSSGNPLYVVTNGRDYTQAGFMDTLGMFWYYQRFDAESNSTVIESTRVFLAEQSIERTRRTCADQWHDWLSAEGVSFNFQKISPETNLTSNDQTVTDLRIRRIAALDDRFHFMVNIEATLTADQQVLIRVSGFSELISRQSREYQNRILQFVSLSAN